MLKSRGKSSGFTLIEVTLAIVIGIVMIAGATLIYNQAKNSAGNSRASAKVLSLQQVVEEFAAQNQGIYPTSIRDLNDLWIRKRPEDWNKSPWGGVTGTTLKPNDAHVPYAPDLANAGGLAVGTLTAVTAVGSFSVLQANVDASTVVSAGTAVAAADSSKYSGYKPEHVDAKFVQAQWTQNNDKIIGALGYVVDRNNSRILFANDLVTGSSVHLKGYAVFIADAAGRFPNFVAGAKPNN